MPERIGVKISEDALLATLAVGEGGPADIASLEACLTAAGVTDGIDWALLAKVGVALSDPTYTLQDVIARGTTSEPGIDGEILMSVNIDAQPGQTRSDGSVDFRDRHSLTTVTAGDLLATIQAPTRGRAGVTVTGKAIPAQNGVEPHLVMGSGVERKGQELQARRDGVLSYVAGQRIDVVQHIEHQADVDYASGNLEVKGSIVISGDVQPKFSVVASDDVIIKGSVAGGTVCAGNAIVVLGGALGKGTELVAGANIDCRHALEATLRSGNTITLADHSMNCRLIADRVCAESGRGTIIGGEIQARSMISICQAGSRGSARTIFAVAIAASEQAILIRLRQDSERTKRREQKRARDKGRRRKGGKGARLGMKQAPRIADMQRQVAKEQARLLIEARIQISGTAHSGVRIRFAEHELIVRSPLQAPVFVFDQDSKTVILEEN